MLAFSAYTRYFEDWLRARFIASGQQLSENAFYARVYREWPNIITLFSDGM